MNVKKKGITIIFNGKKMTVRPGVTISELLKTHPHPGKLKALGAVVGNRPTGLYYRVYSDLDIRTIDLSSPIGMDIYRRTASLLLYAAAHELYPKTRVSVGQSLSDGYYFHVQGQTVNASFVKRLEERMRRYVRDDVPLIPERVAVEEAIARLEKEDFHRQTGLLMQLRRPHVSMIKLGHYYSRTFGPVAERAGLIDRFALFPYEHGVVLAFPDENGVVPTKIAKQPKLFATYLEAKKWNAMMKVENVAELNEKCINGEISDVVKMAEALHEKKIAEIADAIANRKNVRLILIAGPSGSGKTTFMKRLSIHLMLNGIKPVGISIDSYYLDHDRTPRHEDGTYDFEALEALDIELLNSHLKLLMQGRVVEVPYYSFETGRRVEGKGRRVRLEKDQVIILEGIHGLNEALTPGVPQEHKFKIFVSALTQLCLDDHNRIFTTDTRLIRRIIRDRFFRNAPAAATIAAWPSVRAGESKYIFPYQESADAMFNSALVYEHALLKPYAERFLMEVPRSHPSFMESVRLYKFFSYFIPIMSREVPYTSILREFIGGSSFNYG